MLEKKRVEARELLTRLSDDEFDEIKAKEKRICVECEL